MVFSSLLFLYFFLPLSLILYWFSPRKIKNLTLFLVSLLFYAWGEPVYIVLMLLSTMTDYFVGLLLERYDDEPRKRKMLLITSLTVSLGVLGFFKYYAFVAKNIELLTGFPMPEWDPPLPIGISFYTFQTMSYTIDVYRRNVPAQRDFISFGLYVALFPQLIAGPIVRYPLIAEALKNRTVTRQHLIEGTRLFLIGLGKKVLLANNIGALWSEVQALPSHELTVATAWLGMIAFAMQIYFDFSGYSDMARGLGTMFGFRLPINFDYPYISQSITEFWRRWHITLGAWFREYVYIPLGGNRVGQWRLIRNIFIVWLLTGLWHGASWNFALWGLYFAIILMLEKVFILEWLKVMPRWIRHMYASVLILFGWVIFAIASLSSIQDYVSAMFGLQHDWIDTRALYLITTYIGILLLCFICCTPAPRQMFLKLKERQSWAYETVVAVGSIILLLLCTSYLVDATYNPFLYFRF